MDAITLLKNDHKTVEQLFKRFEKAGDNAFVEKRRLVDQIIEELSVHAAVEEQLFYPTARINVEDTDSLTLEAIEEHHIVKWELSELEDMDPRDERFDAKVTVLIENVRHHVEEEESDYFPKVRDELGRNELNDLGDAMVVAKKIAPTRPHPEAPSTPPGNFVVGLVAGTTDRVHDLIKGVAQGSVTAAKDLVARVTGSTRSQPAPTGSSVTRKQAERVRSGADALVDSAVDTADEVANTIGTATSGAKQTAKTARSGAKGVATSAKRSARTTATTAKRASTTTGRTAKSAARSTRSAAKKVS